MNNTTQKQNVEANNDKSGLNNEKITIVRPEVYYRSCEDCNETVRENDLYSYEVEGFNYELCHSCYMVRKYQEQGGI